MDVGKPQQPHPSAAIDYPASTPRLSERIVDYFNNTDPIRAERTQQERSKKKSDRALEKRAKQHKYAKCITDKTPSVQEMEAQLKLIHNNIYNQ